MQAEKGFSLIELLMVVAIIGIIAAIAIPSLIRAKRSAEEAAAVGSLRAYSSAQSAYLSTKGNSSRYGTAVELSDGFIDPAFVTLPARNGYKFTFTLGAGDATYAATADPLDNDPTSRYFFVGTGGVIRYQVGSTASSASTVMGVSVP